jgi:hypothetical protein
MKIETKLNVRATAELQNKVESELARPEPTQEKAKAVLNGNQDETEAPEETTK